MRLTDEQCMLREVARDFARSWLAAHAADAARKADSILFSDAYGTVRGSTGVGVETQ
jgi:hypothetical protein